MFVENNHLFKHATPAGVEHFRQNVMELPVRKLTPKIFLPLPFSLRRTQPLIAGIAVKLRKTFAPFGCASN